MPTITGVIVLVARAVAVTMYSVAGAGLVVELGQGSHAQARGGVFRVRHAITCLEEHFYLD